MASGGGSPKLPDERLYYAVIAIRSGTERYNGQSLVMAAEALEPGTCYGKGITSEVAKEVAEMYRGYFLAKSKKDAVARRGR